MPTIEPDPSSEPPPTPRRVKREPSGRGGGRAAPKSIGPGGPQDASIGPRDAAPDEAALDPNDAGVLARARDGDPAAVKAIVDACIDPIFAVCHRMLGPRDAADVAQDAVVKLVGGLSGFDGRAAVTTWATRIAMNAALGFLRRERYRRHASLDPGADPGSGGGDSDLGILGRIPVEAAEPGPSARIQQTEAVAAVRRGLDEIDPAARAILVLRDLQGLEYDRIAEVLEVPVGTVKSRLYRARAALRERLEEMGHGDRPRPEDPDRGTDG